MMTFTSLIEALILEANTDGAGDAEEFSDTVVNLRTEALRRRDALIEEFGDRARAILDGER
ncbi:hypothetical protein ABT369_39435 [Dactylosporangium sp. NPDC000244]|uniref:hypothetical protein n=1 Tax=Dactylosporangium sp. NPDC000244 TaxID=3154365 RepID=UPI00332DA156